MTTETHTFTVRNGGMFRHTDCSCGWSDVRALRHRIGSRAAAEEHLDLHDVEIPAYAAMFDAFDA